MIQEMEEKLLEEYELAEKHCTESASPISVAYSAGTRPSDGEWVEQKSVVRLERHFERAGQKKRNSARW